MPTADELPAEDVRSATMAPLAPFHTLRSTMGMVCSVDHLASGAGVHVLRSGGNAADAAVATSAVLAVTTQHMCGMGGDLFALVHHEDGTEPACLDASGRAGSGAATAADDLRREGHRRMPTDEDIRAVTVPGCVDGWLTLHERFGRLPLAEVLAPRPPLLHLHQLRRRLLLRVAVSESAVVASSKRVQQAVGRHRGNVLLARC